MAKNAKYYVVWVGAKPGIYTDWASCAAQVNGFPDARYKSFPTRQAAEEAYRNNAPSFNHTSKSTGKRTSVRERIPRNIPKGSISVDAACSGNPGVMEYRGVYTDTGEEIFHQGPFPEGTNNIGEFLAIVHALAMLSKKGDESTTIFSDSKIAQGWVEDGRAKTKLPRSKRNETLFQLIERAEAWLKTHRWKNPVRKWETKDWGEIPADFGRK